VLPLFFFFFFFFFLKKIYSELNLHRLKYVEQELAKKRGKKIDSTDQVENDLKRAEDELYKIPDHLKVTHSLSSIFSVLSLVQNVPLPCHGWCTAVI
jgi:hypothetical protein